MPVDSSYHPALARDPQPSNAAAHARACQQSLAPDQPAHLLFEPYPGANLEPDSKDNYRASRLTAIWMQASVTKAARVRPRFS